MPDRGQSTQLKLNVRLLKWKIAFPYFLGTKQQMGTCEMTKRNDFYIEQHDGQYKVSRANAARASAVVDTQKAAIERAREIDPNAAIHVERVRDIGPGRDKWRKV
jgi:Uncharacterized protein conserved in bacteria (DUF2188)